MIRWSICALIAGLGGALATDTRVPARVPTSPLVRGVGPAVRGAGPRTMIVSGKVLDPWARPTGAAAVSVVISEFTEPFDAWRRQQTVRQTTAAADGSFRVEVPVRSDSWSLDVIAFKPGYGPGWQWVWRDRSPTGLAVPLSRTSFVAGRLIDEGGRPVAGARVNAKWIVPAEFEAGFQIPLEVRPPAITDTQGRFRLAPVPADSRIVLAVDDPRYILPGGDADRIQAGTADTTVSLLRAAAIAGRVVYDDGRPAAKVPVLCLTTGLVVPKETTDAVGHFRFVRLPPGAFVLTTAPTEALADDETDPQRVVLTTDSEARCPDLHLKRLAGSAVLSGKVTEEATGRPVAGVRITTQRSLEKTGMYNMPLNGPTAGTGADGTYRMRLPPGTWHAYAGLLPPGYHLGPLPGGSRDLPAAPGKSFVRDFILRTDKDTMLEGKVLDAAGRPAPAAKLRLWPGGVQMTDIDGQFRLPLSARYPGRPDDFRTRVAVLSLDRSQGVVFDLFSSEVKGMRTLRMRRLPAVAGRVTDARGMPVPGARVRADLLLDRGPWLDNAVTTPLGATTTDRRGRFALPLAPVACRVSAQAAGFAPDQLLVEPGPGKPAPPLVLHLQRGGGSIAGVAVDPDGRLLPGVQIDISPVSPQAGTHAVGGRFSPAPHASSDAQGRFRIDHLPSGPVNVAGYLSGYYDDHRWKVKVGVANLRLTLAPMDQPAAEPQDLPPGIRAPEIRVAQWVNGTGPANLLALRGKTVLLQFSAAYNRAARVSNADLAALQAKLKAAGRDDVTILALYDSSASAEEVAAYARAEGLTFPIGLVETAQDQGPENTAFRAYGVRHLPTLYLIDREGMIRAVDPARQELMQLVAAREGPHHENPQPTK